jgi:hypothetical protein
MRMRVHLIKDTYGPGKPKHILMEITPPPAVIPEVLYWEGATFTYTVTDEKFERDSRGTLVRVATRIYNEAASYSIPPMTVTELVP